MDLQNGVNVRLHRGIEAVLYRQDGLGKELLPEERWKPRKYRGPWLWQLPSPGGLDTWCDCHSGRWSSRRRQLAQLQRQLWKRFNLQPRGELQKEDWVQERVLESNWFSYQFQTHSQVYRRRIGLTMVKFRERQPCRRGPARGSSSRAPAADEHHHCCCCYCHRRVRATPLPIRQFLEVGSSNEGRLELPSFGSVVFNLQGSENYPGVNAHISVMFTAIPEGNGEDTPQSLSEKQPEGKGKEIDRGDKEVAEQGSAMGPPASEAGSREDKDPQDTFPPVGPPPPGVDEEVWRKMWEGRPEGDGWAYIVEDKSLAEEAEAQLAALLPSSTHLQD